MKKLEEKKIVKTCDTCFGRLDPEAYCPNCELGHPTNFHWKPDFESCKTCLFKGISASIRSGHIEGTILCQRFPL